MWAIVSCFQFVLKMLPILTLYDLQYLHRHVWLIKDTSRKRKYPEITRVGVTNR